MSLLSIPETSLLLTFFSMLANDPSSSMLERVYEQSAQQNLSVQHSTSAVLPLPLVIMDPTKLSTMCTCILLAAEQRKKIVDSIASLSRLTFPLQRQQRWFWLRGNLLSFAASAFGSEVFITGFYQGFEL